VSRRRLGFAGALIGTLALVSLLCLEGSVRLFLPQVLPHDVPDLWQPDPSIGWRRAPNVRLVANAGERDVAMCTNAAGDRVDCEAPRRARCAKRVLALGDSYVEALSVPFRETVWGRLESDTGACTSVAGVAAWHLGQYVAAARRRLAEPGARFDLVVLALYPPNDMTDRAEYIPPPMAVQRYEASLLPAGLSVEALREWLAPWNQWLESRSHAYVALRYALRRHVLDRGDVGIYGVPRSLRPSKLPAKWLDETARGVRRVGEIAHRHGARLLVVVIPHRSQVLDPDGARLLASMPELDGDLDMDLVSREFVPRLEALPQVDRVVDLLPPLRARADRELWGERDPHLSPQGHALWFAAIRAPARELLSLR
jgi:hypothetical protein